MKLMLAHKMIPNNSKITKITPSGLLKIITENMMNGQTGQLDQENTFITKLRLKNEKNSMDNMLNAISFSLLSYVSMINICKLDISKLTYYEKSSKKFFETLGDYLPNISHLCLGKACINTENEIDKYDNTDIYYFCRMLESKLVFLKSLKLSNLNLNDDDSCQIIMACNRRPENCQINYFNFSCNKLIYLDYVIPQELSKLKHNLRSLNFSNNNLGFGGDIFAEGSDAEDSLIQILKILFVEFSMLSNLKMNNCNFGNKEGNVIAGFLVECNCKKIDIGNNAWNKEVKQKLRTAWKYSLKKLIC